MQTVPDLKTLSKTLLTAGDPPAFMLRTPDGAGPGIILCDHASNAVPKSLNGLGLPSATMETHIAYDIGARAVAEIVSDHLDMPAVVSSFSRLVLDLNRPQEDFTSIREIYDGSIIPGNRHLSEPETEARIAEILLPYHDTATDILTRKVTSCPNPAVISIHSCTDIIRGETRPWHIGVLSNSDRRMADPMLRHLKALRPDLTIGDNKPYSGMDPHGYTIETHALPFGHPNILFEVRQDLVGNAAGQKEFGTLLAETLALVLQDNALFAPFQG